MKVIKKAGSILISALLWIVILVAALYTFVTLATRDETTVAGVAGYSPMIVQTDSMAPTFDAGDLIIIRSCDPATLQEGDIITFHTIINNTYALNTHRIASIDESNGARSYTTKGDNNAVEDQHVIADGDIVGKYVKRIPKFGKVMSFLSSSTGFLLVIVLPMLIFFIYQVYHLIMVLLEIKRVAAAEEAAKAVEQSYAEAEAEKIRAEEEAAKAKAEAQKALEEALRMKEEAERALAEAKALQGEKGEK